MYCWSTHTTWETPNHIIWLLNMTNTYQRQISDWPTEHNFHHFEKWAFLSAWIFFCLIIFSLVATLFSFKPSAKRSWDRVTLLWKSQCFLWEDRTAASTVHFLAAVLVLGVPFTNSRFNFFFLVGVLSFLCAD